MIGKDIHSFASQLWRMNRSLTGDGVRQTLSTIKDQHLPDLSIREIPSGTKVFDWSIPLEWRVHDAYILTPSGDKICDFQSNNVHLVGYSIPIETELTLESLQPYLYSLPEQPNAIPYITSYYERRWGFCLTHQEREKLKPGKYKVVVHTELFEGSLTYADLVIKGETSKEIFLSTYLCHPSLANDNLSGVTVTTFLAKWINSLANRYFTYRILWIPETIGSIAYLSEHKDHMRQSVVAGFNVTCVGDERQYSFLPSRNGNTPSDHVAKHVLRHTSPNFITYPWRKRGSDERQYCSPGIDLPIASIMRTKYGDYKEYHTSLDNLTEVVTPKGLIGGYEAIQKAIMALESNVILQSNILCEPQLGSRNLYPTLSRKGSKDRKETAHLLADILTWSDGTCTLLEIADQCEKPVWELLPLVEKLKSHDLVTVTRPTY